MNNSSKEFGNAIVLILITLVIIGFAIGIEHMISTGLIPKI